MQYCVTNNSLGNGIVLWELQEQKCQQRVCQQTDVVQSGQDGWILLILQWKMVEFLDMSALAITLMVANTIMVYLQKTVDPTSFTNFTHLIVLHATVA